jgi:hypothetical protein
MQFMSLPNEVEVMNIPERTIALCQDMKYTSARHSKKQSYKAAFDSHKDANHPSSHTSSNAWNDEYWIEEGNVVADLRRKKKTVSGKPETGRPSG